jgi:hypothetical protein
MDSTIIKEKNYHFSRFCGYNAYGYVFYACRELQQLQDRIVLTERVKRTFTALSRWFKVIRKRRI